MVHGALPEDRKDLFAFVSDEKFAESTTDQVERGTPIESSVGTPVATAESTTA
jgi:hypothetical protein